MINAEYINSSGRKVIEYYPPDSIMVDLHFILTQNRILTRNMPYMFLEKRVIGNYVAAVRLIDFFHKDDIVTFKVQELASKKEFDLSSNMEYSGEFWMWCLADIQSLIRK